MSRQVSNQAPDRSVTKPRSRKKARVPTCAAELSDQQIRFAALMQARNHESGLDLSGYCYMFGIMKPTEVDRLVMERRLAELVNDEPSLLDSLLVERIGWEEWFRRKYGEPPRVFVWKQAKRETHYTH